MFHKLLRMRLMSFTVEKTACKVNLGWWLVGRAHPSQQFTQTAVATLKYLENTCHSEVRPKSSMVFLPYEAGPSSKTFHNSVGKGLDSFQ